MLLHDCKNQKQVRVFVDSSPEAVCPTPLPPLLPQHPGLKQLGPSEAAAAGHLWRRTSGPLPPYLLTLWSPMKEGEHGKLIIVFHISEQRMEGWAHSFAYCETFSCLSWRIYQKNKLTQTNIFWFDPSEVNFICCQNNSDFRIGIFTWFTPHRSRLDLMTSHTSGNIIKALNNLGQIMHNKN